MGRDVSIYGSAGGVSAALVLRNITKVPTIEIASTVMHVVIVVSLSVTVIAVG
jgi:hypothetical protein